MGNIEKLFFPFRRSLGISFSDIERNAIGRTTHLINKSIALMGRELPDHEVDPNTEFMSLLPDYKSFMWTFVHIFRVRGWKKTTRLQKKIFVHIEKFCFL